MNKNWVDRCVRMFKWAGRSWWAGFGALLAWATPEHESSQLLRLVFTLGLTCMGFVLLGLFCFSMALWKESGLEK